MQQRLAMGPAPVPLQRAIQYDDGWVKWGGSRFVSDEHRTVWNDINPKFDHLLACRDAWAAAKAGSQSGYKHDAAVVLLGSVEPLAVKYDGRALSLEEGKALQKALAALTLDGDPQEALAAKEKALRKDAKRLRDEEAARKKREEEEAAASKAEAAKEKAKAKKKAKKAAVTPPTAEPSASSAASNLEPWVVPYVASLKIKFPAWNHGMHVQQVQELRKNIAPAQKKYDAAIAGLTAAADSPANVGYKGEIEAELARLRARWPAGWDNTFDGSIAYLKTIGEVADAAAASEARATRGWNYLTSVQAVDKWWAQLPETSNAEIKQIATHAAVGQHTEDHRPATVAAFRTALNTKHYEIDGGKVKMLNGSGHLYDQPALGDVTLSTTASSLERVYAYAYKNGTAMGGADKGGNRKKLSAFPRKNSVGEAQPDITLAKPLVVIVNTRSNDLSKDPGTAYIKD